MIDRLVLALSLVTAALLLLLFTPRNKIHEAQIVFLFVQFITWVLGLLAVEFQLLEYPVREFTIATQTSFSFEYFILPATCVIFVLRLPRHKSISKVIGWYLFWPTWMTVVEVLIERHTNLIKFLNWNWFYTWSSLLLGFLVTHAYYKWFMRKWTLQSQHQ
ncbi:CBO0543 family protein [Paenibacillus koleovorans]|uniref:CBO0543 family protein n=1 Tax=Paenibacillus koleovorans TaxID=121608 RepID=UPI000FD86E19|nr:CBO0543 family protein [Paenibacillus koleovorans]